MSTPTWLSRRASYGFLLLFVILAAFKILLIEEESKIVRLRNDMDLKKDGTGTTFTTTATIRAGNSNKSLQVSDSHHPPLPLFKQYTSNDDISMRSNRFPSLDERVRVYMKDWYAPPCGDEQKLSYFYSSSNSSKTNAMARKPPNLLLSYDKSIHLHDIDGSTTSTNKFSDWTSVSLEPFLERDRPFFLAHNRSSHSVVNCKVHRGFCADLNANLWKSLETIDNRHIHEQNQHNITAKLDGNDNIVVPATPILLLVGDFFYWRKYGGYANVPLLQKFRMAGSVQELREVTASKCRNTVPKLTSVLGRPEQQPVVWKMHVHHKRFVPMGSFANVVRDDIFWHEKRKLPKEPVVWRGALSKDEGYQKKSSDRDNCLAMPQCRLVYNNWKSPLLDAGITDIYKERVPDRLNDVKLLRDTKSINEMMQYKGIIIMEGGYLTQDVAPDLQWALLSNSVVFMPRPRQTSWIMQELLEPWVHYIPLKNDLSDVQEQIQWMVDNDDQARGIAERATLWIQDLAFHPEEEQVVQEEILRRYSAHFQPSRG